MSDADASRVYVFKRLIAALLTGNGDLHMENFSLLQQNGKTEFSPVYDPTPMRAYPIHDIQNVMPFGNYGDYIHGRNDPVDFTLALKRFMKASQLKQDAANTIISDLLDIGQDYPDRIQDLTTLPDV